MRICWDTIENLRYSKKTGKFYKGKTTYLYIESCKVCGEPFLSQPHGKGLFCSHSCRSFGVNNVMYGKNHTKKSRQKMSIIRSDGRLKRANNPRWKGGISRNSDGTRNLEYGRQYVKSWRKNNPDKVRAAWAKKRCLKEKQTPTDVNENKINFIYGLCHRLNVGAARIVFHVDHVVPISKGGLHHENNLRILPAFINLSKGAEVSEKWGNVTQNMCT